MAVNKFICQPLGHGPEEETGGKALAKIRDHLHQREKTSSAASSSSPSTTLPSVFCIVYTYHGNIQFTNAIIETWGTRCDGILFASTISNTLADAYEGNSSSASTASSDVAYHVLISHNSKFEGKYQGKTSVCMFVCGSCV